jgi:competence protein ComEC
MSTIMLTGCALAFATGAWLLQQQADLPDLTGLYLLLPGAMLCAAATRRRSAWIRACARMATVILAVAAGFLWAGLMAQWRLADRLDPRWEDRGVVLVGVVAALPDPGEHGVRFRFDIEQVEPADARVPERVLLTWYSNDAFGEVNPQELRAGQRWRLAARLRRPHGNANPHGFDYEAWLFDQGIRATGSVQPEPLPKLVDPQVSSPGLIIERMRGVLRERVLHALPDAPYAGTLAALVMGDQRSITHGDWQVFTRTGINHLMSISGLHITMLGALAFFLVRVVWRLWPRLALLVAAQRAAILAGAATAWFYALLSGFAVPSQRTVLMLTVVAVALWVGVNTSSVALLALALVAVLLADPLAVQSAGFWLSFASVAILMLSTSGLVGTVPWYAAWGRAQWAITVALTPILLVLFQQVSLVSPVANLIAVPVVSFAVVPLALLGSVFDWQLPLSLAHALMGWLMVPLRAFSEAPAAVWGQHAPLRWTWIPALSGVLWILMPRGVPARWVGGLLLLPLFLNSPAGPAAGELWVSVLDVGQGLAVVVRTERHALLFDAGPRYGATSSAGDHVVVPYLRGEGIVSLDRFIISHDDSDHTGGVGAVLRAVPVGLISTSVEQSRFVPVRAARCEAGERWVWDGVRFEMLHPSAHSYTQEFLKNNDRSCVLRVVSKHGRVLVTGDIEKNSEAEVLHNYTDVAAEVLVVPHHGSGTSSTPSFIARVAPRLAIFSAGYHNRFGHPKIDVVMRYRQTGARLLRSDQDGMIMVKFAGDGMDTSTWRNGARRYWNNQ